MAGFEWKTQWAVLLVAIAVVQWIVFLAISWSSRRPYPKNGKRRSERGLIFSTAALAVVWLVAFDVRALFGSRPAVNTAVATSSSPRTPSRGTCASITVGMKADEVKAKLGEPDQEVTEEDYRGPGAKKWIYQSSRCAVHLLDDAVEVTD